MSAGLLGFNRQPKSQETASHGNVSRNTHQHGHRVSSDVRQRRPHALAEDRRNLRADRRLLPNLRGPHDGLSDLGEDRHRKGHWPEHPHHRAIGLLRRGQERGEPVRDHDRLRGHADRRLQSRGRLAPSCDEQFRAHGGTYGHARRDRLRRCRRTGQVDGSAEDGAHDDHVPREGRHREPHLRRGPVGRERPRLGRWLELGRDRECQGAARTARRAPGQSGPRERPGREPLPVLGTIPGLRPQDGSRLQAGAPGIRRARRWQPALRGWV